MSTCQVLSGVVLALISTVFLTGGLQVKISAFPYAEPSICSGSIFYVPRGVGVHAIFNGRVQCSADHSISRLSAEIM